MNDIPILMADDDEDDCLLVADALQEAGLSNPLLFVHNGEQLLDYLERRPPYTNPNEYPLPGLILLDLNMPIKDGHAALDQIKANPKLRAIPVVVLSTTGDKVEVRKCYAQGASTFITKPVDFDELVGVLSSIGGYWFKVASLPI